MLNDINAFYEESVDELRFFRVSFCTQLGYIPILTFLRLQLCLSSLCNWPSSQCLTLSVRLRPLFHLSGVSLTNFSLSGAR